MVLTLQEPSFTAAGDGGQRQTHPHAPSYCLGTGTCRGRSASPPSSRGRGTTQGLGASWDTQRGGILQPCSFTACENLPKGLCPLPQSDVRQPSQLAAICSG